MKVKLIGKKRLVSLTLPQRIYGNYWITNEDNENLINIEAQDNKWFIKSNSDIKITVGDNFIDSAELVQNHFYHFFDVTNNEKYRVFIGETFDSQMVLLDFNEKEYLEFTVGNSTIKEEGRPNYISYENPMISYNQLLITRSNGLYYIKNLNPLVNMYVNKYLTTEGYVKYGDVIFIEGLTLSFVGNTLMLGTVGNKVKYVTSKFTPHKKTKLNYKSIDSIMDQSIELYDKEDYYVRPPRFSEIIEDKDITIDSPPAKQETEQMPVLLTLGPMVIMGMSSAMTGAMAIMKVVSGEATFKDNAVSIITAVAMLCAMLLFPSANKAYQKRRERKKEALRQKKYSEYLATIDKQIKDEIIRQRRILIENNVSLKDVGDVLLYKKRNLWERKVSHEDFLELRLGIGNVRPKINIAYQKEGFTLEEDNLKQELLKIIDQNAYINDVPVTMNFRQKYISSLIGKSSILRRFVDGLLLQMLAYHSYDELKIVVLTNADNAKYWEKLKDSPYVWDNERQTRFFATDPDEINRLCQTLEEEWEARAVVPENSIKENKVEYHMPHYFIITDDVYSVSKTGLINDILKSNQSYGFSILYLTEHLNSLPSECSSFVSVDANLGGIFEQELVNKKQEFVPDYTETTIDNYIYAASNIPIEIGGSSFTLPDMYSFLEMYDAGNVEQLNAFNRWQKNDPTTSLSAPVGIDENGELFKLDLHEKVHGPHGLIAGMTGSGKSEFIITYILSMAINFNPYEVQFVLIDYKGGGLAGAFENKETGMYLPHLAGTITNLDVTEINRSLSSLQSELKRRQRIFNEARDKCNESTIDIYKYQKLYREGKVDEPISHLLIISDEFAELKSQQPDFMDELISTARIGRSLGVHLILATQKPSGVVDEQIWSNSKFRVCLKVQDKSDSNDMIKSPDAAYIKETGRFYLQVGFNEFFAKGQSAWTGAPYYESDKRKKMIDHSLNFVDNLGVRIKTIDDDRQNQRGIHKGEEIASVLNYLVNLGKEENIQVRKLWLDRIPAEIYIDPLKLKYKFKKQPFVINPIIGEYDAPKEQRQGLLTLPISEEGNLILYGAIGSGKEDLISSLIYSLITTYTTEEVSIYILDFGSEALKVYEKVKHIGGVVSSNDADRVTTLFKLLKSKMEIRKKLFAEYNGSYQNFIKNSGKTMPTVVTIINGFESFDELYPDIQDDLILLTREGAKYGLFFITTASAINNIRMKISQNFNQRLLLQMNDEYDYRQVYGRTEVKPSKIKGRGLCKLQDVYEFQSASVASEADFADHLAKVIDVINEQSTFEAEAIPTLPETVTTEFVAGKFTGLSSVPIGVAKESLNILTVDLKNQPSLLISANNINDTRTLVSSLIAQISTIKNNATYVIDAEKLLSDEFENVKYHSGQFENVFNSFKDIINKLNEEYEKSDYDPSSLDKYGDMTFVIIGIDKIKTIMGSKFDEVVGTPLMTSKKLSKTSYIFVDTFDNLKKLEYDLWYKDIINSTRGIWLGEGIADQTIFKTYGSMRNIPNEIPSNFGFNIISGNPVLFKYIESYDTVKEEASEETL